MLGSREVTTRGVVIARTSRGEGSVRISLYTEEFGLIWAIARSAREERSKLRPHLQVGTYGVFTLIKGAQEWRVTGAVETENSYFSLLHNEPAQKSVTRVLSVVRQLMHGEDTDIKLFDSLWKFLNQVGELSKDSVALAERVVLLTILFQSGYVSEKHIPPLPESYEETTVQKLRESRQKLTKAINEGFVASGLIS